MKVLPMQDLCSLVSSKVKENDFFFKGDDADFKLSVTIKNSIISIAAECSVDLNLEEHIGGGHYNEHYFNEVNVRSISYQTLKEKHSYPAEAAELEILSEHLRDLLNSAKMYDYYDEHGSHIRFSNIFAKRKAVQ